NTGLLYQDQQSKNRFLLVSLELLLPRRLLFSLSSRREEPVSFRLPPHIFLYDGKFSPSSTNRQHGSDLYIDRHQSSGRGLELPGSVTTLFQIRQGVHKYRRD